MTYYLCKDFNGGDEDYWHLVNESYEYAPDTNIQQMLGLHPLSLGANFPNPVRLNTTIPYQIRNYGHVLIEVLNSQGSIVDILVNRKVVPGNHMVTWNAANKPAGVYLYRMRFKNLEHTNNMLVIH